VIIISPDMIKWPWRAAGFMLHLLSLLNLDLIIVRLGTTRAQSENEILVFNSVPLHHYFFKLGLNVIGERDTRSLGIPLRRGEIPHQHIPEMAIRIIACEIRKIIDHFMGARTMISVL
jgi:hypothetical protein